MKNLKRNAVIVTVLLFVCVAVYLNWSYNNKWGTPDNALVKAEDAAKTDADAAYEASMQDNNAKSANQTTMTNDYFATARLTRQQSRDEALSLLQQAAAAETASQETIDTAISEISVMANYSMEEAQIENLLVAKDFADCVVFRSNDGITVAVPAPVEGLSAASVARITDVITSETGMSASQIRIIEVKDGIETSVTDSETPNADAMDVSTDTDALVGEEGME